ncbi:hypothetical protein PCE1_001966 [Barthelona sp. PCE]
MVQFGEFEKSRAAYARYQVKPRRRRSGQTDYQARKKLVTQAKNKYASLKYRLVVRFTNRDIVAQIIYATIAGDKVFCAAYGHELERYGLKVGLTNYASAYCVGLLLARRVLKKLGLDEEFVGLEECNGEEYDVTEDSFDRRPFKVLLDIGLRRSSTGARVFAAMKGAVDGGLNVPHSMKRLIGSKGDEFDAEELRWALLGGKTADYMRLLEKEDPEKYAVQFRDYIRKNVSADDLEDIYLKVHENIRESPEMEKSSKTHDPKYYKQTYVKAQRRTLSQRKDRIRQKLASLNERRSKKL